MDIRPVSLMPSFIGNTQGLFSAFHLLYREIDLELYDYFITVGGVIVISSSFFSLSKINNSWFITDREDRDTI